MSKIRLTIKVKKERDIVMGDTVYHIAHPEIPATVTDRNSIKIPGDAPYIEVVFSEPVRFLGNSWRGSESRWLCSKKLLFLSQEKARRLHNQGIDSCSQ